MDEICAGVALIVIDAVHQMLAIGVLMRGDEYCGNRVIEFVGGK